MLEQQLIFSICLFFRVEGIAQTIIAIFGIFGNLVATFILTRKEMRNAFNLVTITIHMLQPVVIQQTLLK